MTIKAWHFVRRVDGKDLLRDGREVPPDGEWLVHEGELVLCKSGLHCSGYLLDALGYAPGTILCRVGVRGKIIHGGDKLDCSERRVEWRLDVKEILPVWVEECSARVPRSVRGAYAREMSVCDQRYDVLCRHVSFSYATARHASESAFYAAQAIASVYDDQEGAFEKERDWQEQRLLRLIEEARA